MAHWMGKQRTMTDSPDFKPSGEKCEYCDFLFEPDEIRKTLDDDSICPYCMNDFDFVECQCGAVFEKSEAMICPSCGHLVGKDDE